MNILIVNNSILPVTKYGGTERVIWCLGKELGRLNHKVYYLVKPGSTCDFATVLNLNDSKTIAEQIPDFIDVVHFNFPIQETILQPHLTTLHGNAGFNEMLDQNTVFVSKNHATRFGAEAYVYNGLDWNEYGKPHLNNNRSYFHFLGKAGLRNKNVRGAIRVVLKTKTESLKVLGGNRLNVRMGFRFTISPRISFVGMVGGNRKIKMLENSKGLIFPVIWNEPFGLSIIESLYMGCPVFGTPYGSLPELITEEAGFLSSDSTILAEKLKHIDDFDRSYCHQYASDVFNSKKMAEEYLKKYEMVLNKQPLNTSIPTLKERVVERFLPWK